MTARTAHGGLRTSASARAMFTAASQPQDIWIAATVTGRGGRRKCSGSELIAHPP